MKRAIAVAMIGDAGDGCAGAADECARCSQGAPQDAAAAAAGGRGDIHAEGADATSC